MSRALATDCAARWLGIRSAATSTSTSAAAAIATLPTAAVLALAAPLFGPLAAASLGGPRLSLAMTNVDGGRGAPRGGCEARGARLRWRRLARLLQLARAPRVTERRLLRGAEGAEKFLSPTPRDAHAVGARARVGRGIGDAAKAGNGGGIADQAQPLLCCQS